MMVDVAERSAALRLAAGVGAPEHLVQRLAAIHARQWGLEQQARRGAASDHRLARLKRAIDASNDERHRVIDAIDAAVAYRAPPTATRLYSETVGELCDRLVILERKAAAVDALGDHAAIRRRREGVERSGRHLERVARELAADIAAGRAVCPPRVGFKLY